MTRKKSKGVKSKEAVQGVEPSSAEGVELEGSGAEFQRLEVLGSIPGGLVLSSEEGFRAGGQGFDSQTMPSFHKKSLEADGRGLDSLRPSSIRRPYRI